MRSAKTAARILRGRRGSMQFSESLALKAVSILLALILWITILGFKRETIVVHVKLEPRVPLGMMIVNKIQPTIQFTLTGPRVWLKEAEKRIAPIRPDLSHARDNNIEFSISENLLGELPPTVLVKDFSPTQISIQLEEVVERYITVKATLVGSPAPGYEVSHVKVIPSKVAVSGPKRLLEREEFISTEPFDIKDLEGTREGEAVVEVEENKGYQLSREKSVSLRVTTRKVRN
jgi:YbbR domain-containing protein